MGNCCKKSDKTKAASLADPLNPEGRRSSSGAVRWTPDDFIIHKVLGKGAYGQVYLVTEKSSEGSNVRRKVEKYAMKVVEKSLLTEKNQTKFVEREKDILMHFKHPFIVQLKCTFQDKESFYFVFEFMAGGDLFHHLKNAQKFTIESTRFYAAQIVIALGYLHDRKIIYRDLKPENVLMDDRGYVKLSDFGLSKEADQSSTFCGTTDYMAPEMISGMGHDKNLDWWMLGVLVYEMITGKPPFMASNSMQIFKKISEVGS